MKTIIELFETTVSNYPNNVYLWEKREGKYEGTTYKETRELVIRLAAGLVAIGMKKGDRSGLMADGCNNWIISELGVLYAGGVNVPLSIRLHENELMFRLQHSGSRYIFVSAPHAAKAEAIRDALPELEKIIYLNGKNNPGKDDISLKDLFHIGENYLKDHGDEVDKIWQSIQPNDLANISYTSGTTADPKGIMLSHLNYAANVIQSNTLMELHPEWRTLAILPWDHAFAHTCCLYAFMFKGASIASVEVGRSSLETLKNIPVNIKEIQPTLMMSVPAFSKKFRQNIEGQIQKKGKFLSNLFQFSLKVSYLYNGLGYNRGRGWKIILKPLIWLFDIILYKKIRQGFGGELKFFVGGGALLDIELQRFFYAIGMPVCQGYGLTEASPVISSNALHALKLGSSGRLVKYLELKIMDEEGNELPTGQKGEIVIKGDNVMMGYWNNPAATADTIKNGWLHTGDMGYMDKDEFLFVLGRFKSLLIGNDGEKYSPEGIEEAIVEKSTFIQQMMLYNNQNPYTSAMVVPNIEAINRELKKRGMKPGSDEGNSESLQLLSREINQFKKGGENENMFPERWLPATFVVLPETFNQENGLVNTTMKMVRGKICEYFNEQLEFLYTPLARNIENEVNLSVIKKWNT
ncbi:MAG: AMP-binding protein [Mariniphaga sp.]|nr:AMP-binding protein [Mariniphaga sp.]MDD4225253.1 AMP-binding protein [Mariniphaga sp.]MDD4424564.1 AMP-binding protein [Mariniphaga sp.]